MGREARVRKLRVSVKAGTPMVSMSGTAREFYWYMRGVEDKADLEAEAAELLSEVFGG